MLKCLYLIIKMFFKTKIQLLLEIAMLTKQLEIYKRTDPKLKIKRTDRMFFSLMKDILSNWKERIVIVRPNTIMKWHREGFRIYWKWKSISFIRLKNIRSVLFIFSLGSVRL